MTPVLTSPLEAGWREAVGRLLDVASTGSLAAVDIEVSDDVLFGARWLPLGSITVADGVDAPGHQDRPRPVRLSRAAQLGEYAWAVPTFESVTLGLKALVPADAKFMDADLRRPLESVAHAAVRCGLVMPTFDAGIIRGLPLSRPVIVVPDSCSVTQGGLNACCRLLRPAVRVKIPSVVQLEIVNMADNYFSRRRGMSTKGKTPSSRAILQALLNRANSQGGQRALLQLALHSGLDVERVAAGGDPLRGIASLSVENEDRDAGITTIARSYADRLVVESALNTKDTAGQQEVFVLTSDQGVAKMALADGIRSVYFDAVGTASVFGRTLAGSHFSAMQSAGDARVKFTSLGALVWELAVTFGSCRLVAGEHRLTIAAMGQDFRWMLYHAADDLLWMTAELPPAPVNVPKLSQDAESATREGDETPEKPKVHETRVNADLANPRGPRPCAPVLSTRPQRQEIGDATSTSEQRANRPLVGTFGVRLGALVSLVAALGAGRPVSDKAGKEIVGVSADRRYRDYRNFLVAAGIATANPTGLVPTDDAPALREALLRRDMHSAIRLLQRAPSFGAFLTALREKRTIGPDDAVPGVAMRDGLASYGPLCEALCTAVRQGTGLVWTGDELAAASFAPVAVQAFNQVRRDNETHVLTGDWLLEVARVGIHPELARVLLEEAQTNHLLERYVEGSSPATADHTHRMFRIETQGGQPKSSEVDLYDGSYLPTGRASVFLRIIEGAK